MSDLILVVVVLGLLAALVLGIIRWVGVGPRDDDGSGHF